MKDQENRELAAQIAGEGVTKEDHIAGYKVLEVNTKWGAGMKLKITALGWRALQRLLRRSNEEKWDEVETSAQMVMASLVDCQNDRILDHLDNESAVRLQRVVSALAFGEKAISPNGVAPAISKPPAESPLPKPASESSVNLPVPASEYWDGPRPGSPSLSPTLHKAVPAAT